MKAGASGLSSVHANVRVSHRGGAIRNVVGKFIGSLADG